MNETQLSGVPLVRPGALNVYTMIPCPLRPRFQRMWQDFSARWPTTGVPLWNGAVEGLDHDDVDGPIQHATSPGALPHILVATGFHWALCRSFREKFLDTGLFRAWSPRGAQALPEEWERCLASHHVGLLGMGGWVLVCDTSRNEELPLPRRWVDLARPEYRGHITFHGCDGNPGYTPLLRYLQEQGGDGALAGFSRNLGPVRHFSQILKGLGSREHPGTRFNILPCAAAWQIPSGKPAGLVDLEDGDIMLPVMVMVARDMPPEGQRVLDFLGSREVADLLSLGGVVPAGALDESRRWCYPDLDALLAEDAFVSADRLAGQCRSMRDPATLQACCSGCGCGSRN